MNCELELTEKECFTLWRLWDKKGLSHERYFKRDLVLLFNDIEKSIYDNIDGQKSRHANNSYLQKADILNIANLFNPADWRKKLNAYFDKDMVNMIIDNMELAFNQISVDWDGVISDFDLQVSQAVTKCIDLLMLSLNTLSQELKQIIIDAIGLQGDLKQNLKDMIGERFKRVKSSKVETIARTAATFIRGASQEIAWNDYDVDIFWLSQRDGKVRSSHMAADKQKRVDGYFHVGTDIMPYPAGGSQAAENARCRCTTYAVRRKK